MIKGANLIGCLIFLVGCQSSPCQHEQDLLVLRSYIGEYLANTVPDPQLTDISQQRISNEKEFIWKLLQEKTDYILPKEEHDIYQLRSLPRAKKCDLK